MMTGIFKEMCGIIGILEDKAEEKKADAPVAAGKEKELIQGVLAICGKAKVLPMHTESFKDFKKIWRANRVVELKKGDEYVVG